MWSRALFFTAALTRLSPMSNSPLCWASIWGWPHSKDLRQRNWISDCVESPSELRLIRECWREFIRDSLCANSRWNRARRNSSIPAAAIRSSPLKTARELRKANMVSTPTAT